MHTCIYTYKCVLLKKIPICLIYVDKNGNLVLCSSPKRAPCASYFPKNS